MISDYICDECYEAITPAQLVYILTCFDQSTLRQQGPPKHFHWVCIPTGRVVSRETKP